MLKLSASAGEHSCRNAEAESKPDRSCSAGGCADTTYTQEPAELGDQSVRRSADLTVRGRDGLQVTWQQKHSTPRLERWLVLDSV